MPPVLLTVLSQPGVDPPRVLGMRCRDHVEVTPAGIHVVVQQRAAGAEGARDAVGAAGGHDRVVAALRDQRRYAETQRCRVVGRQDSQQRPGVRAGPEQARGRQRRMQARGGKVIDAAGLGNGEQAAGRPGE
jgi:hypothetical protein